MGKLEEAIISLERAVELAEKVPDHNFRAWSSGYLGRCYLQKGDLKRAQTMLEEGNHLRRKHKVIVNWNIPLLNGLAELYLSAAE